MANVKPKPEPEVTQPKPEPAGGNIYQRLNRVQQAVTFVSKSKPQGMRYSIVSHDAVTAKCRPALVANGVIYLIQDLEAVQNGNRTEARFVVRFQNIHDPKDYVEVPTMGYGIDDQDKGPGKAISYGVKTALLKTLGLESGEGEDPDYDQETTHQSEETGNAVQKFELLIEDATDTEVLRVLADQIADAYALDKTLDKATTLALRGKVRKKVEELKAKPKEEDDAADQAAEASKR
jgi:hypothetical protein